MLKPTLALLFLVPLLGAAVPRETVDLIDPFVGKGHFGKTLPGAATPGGMVQFSPDAITGGNQGSRYHTRF